MAGIIDPLTQDRVLLPRRKEMSRAITDGTTKESFRLPGSILVPGFSDSHSNTAGAPRTQPEHREAHDNYFRGSDAREKRRLDCDP